MAGMEFSYRISEVDYWNALKLKSNPPRYAQVKAIAFWAFILICLVLLWAVVTRNGPKSSTSHPVTTAQQSAANGPHSSSSLDKTLVNLGPSVAILILVVFSVIKRGPALRAIHRKDPTMQGEFTVKVTPESISIQNTAGTSSKSGWNIYACWREGRDVIVLLPHTNDYLNTGTVQILSLAGLSDFQRAELRGILSTALPKK
jgi:hypothetical protein